VSKREQKCVPRFLDSTQFAQADDTHSWLVEQVMVAGQPGVIGGAKKTLKTSLAIDVAISIGTGTRFLGRFPVPQKRRVAFLSGESGPSTLQETARRVCKARKVSLEKCDVLWSFDLPQLSSKSALGRLGAALEENEVTVVFIDPLYLCLLGSGGASATNLFETGPMLRQATLACLDAGATPIFLHHTTKGSGKKSESIDLDDLSFSGVAEFARQWLLIGRRTPYVPGTGRHELHLTIGGSAGQSGSWDVDVEEGVLGDDFKGRKWDVVTRRAGQAPPAKADKPKKGFDSSVPT
jgi:replicative DNA helicase